MTSNIQSYNIAPVDSSAPKSHQPSLHHYSQHLSRSQYIARFRDGRLLVAMVTLTFDPTLTKFGHKRHSLIFAPSETSNVQPSK